MMSNIVVSHEDVKNMINNSQNEFLPCPLIYGFVSIFFEQMLACWHAPTIPTLSAYNANNASYLGSSESCFKVKHDHIIHQQTSGRPYLLFLLAANKDII